MSDVKQRKQRSQNNSAKENNGHKTKTSQVLTSRQTSVNIVYILYISSSVHSGLQMPIIQRKIVPNCSLTLNEWLTNVSVI